MVILSVLLLIAFVLIFLEVRRPLKRFLLPRIIATAMLLLAIWFIFFPLRMSTAGNKSASEFVLLTNGFSNDSVSKAKGNLITFDKTISEKTPNVKYYSSAAVFKMKHPHSSINIYGNGLVENELANLSGSIKSFHPSINTGAVAAGWTKKVNHQFIFQSRYVNEGDDEVQLKLLSFNTTLDSIIIEKKVDTSFSLIARPQQSGLSVYRYIGLKAKDTLFQYPVPFSAATVLKPSVLLLSTSPDFELTYLRNWLADNGYAASSSAPVTRGRSVSVFNNAPSQSVASPAAFAKADLVIVDEGSFRNNTATLAAAMNNGLGVLVITSSSLHGLGANAILRHHSVTGNNFKVSLPGNSKTFSALFVDEPRVISANNNAKALANLGNNALVQQTIYGNGKLSVSALNQTFQWLLQGNHNDYANYWSYIIGNAARDIKLTSRISTDNLFPQVNDMLTMNAIATFPDSLLIEDEGFPFVQKQNQREVWSTSFWPQHAGWLQVKNGKNNSSWLYVFENKDWKEARVQELIEKNKEMIAKQKTDIPLTNATVETTVSEIIWYVLFLLAAAFLWAERKWRI